MKPQLFLGKRQPTEVTWRPITNRGAGIPKPHGGLWTSSWHADRRTSDWLEWCYDNMPEWVRPAWLLTPAPNARIYTIDSVADLKRLSARYTCPVSEDMRQLSALMKMHPPLDFEAIAADYDAIHLTSDGQAHTRFSTPSLYGWDVESTLWLHWTFTAVESIVVATQAEYEAWYTAEYATGEGD